MRYVLYRTDVNIAAISALNGIPLYSVGTCVSVVVCVFFVVVIGKLFISMLISFIFETIFFVTFILSILLK